MKIKKIVGGYGGIVICEVEDDIYAFVDTKRDFIKYDWYWLYVAKYEPVRSPDQIEDEIIEKAYEMLKNAEIDEEWKDELVDKIKRLKDKAKILFEDQDKLIKQSKEKQKGIYLT